MSNPEHYFPDSPEAEPLHQNEAAQSNTTWWWVLALIGAIVAFAVARPFVLGWLDQLTLRLGIPQ